MSSIIVDSYVGVWSVKWTRTVERGKATLRIPTASSHHCLLFPTIVQWMTSTRSVLSGELLAK